MDYNEGDEYSAEWLNELKRMLRASKITSDGSILVNPSAFSQDLRANLPEEADFRISSGTNPYGGVEQWAIAGGAWATNPDGLTVTITNDPLYERGANAAVVVGTVVHCRRDAHSGRWIFDRRACSAATVSTPSVPDPTTPTKPPSDPSPAPTPPSPAPSPTPPTKPTVPPSLPDPTPPADPPTKPIELPPSEPTPPTKPIELPPSEPSPPVDPPFPWPPPTLPTPGYPPPAGPITPPISDPPLPTLPSPMISPAPTGWGGSASTARDSIQLLTPSGVYTGVDTFIVRWSGHNSAAISMTASAATMQTAIQGISGIGALNVLVTLNGLVWQVEFTGSLAHAAQGTFSIAAAPANGTITPSVLQLGSP
jgi:hypothetical protein